MTQYRIRAGFSVRIDERRAHHGGDVVELDADTAAQHAHKLEVAQVETQFDPETDEIDPETDEIDPPIEEAHAEPKRNRK